MNNRAKDSIRNRPEETKPSAISSGFYSSKLKSVFLYTCLIVIAGICGIVFKPVAIDSIRSTSILWSTFATVGLLLFLNSLHAQTRSINNPFGYFVLASYVCWFGQFLLVSLSIKVDKPTVINTFQPDLFYNTSMYATLGFLAMCLAGLIFVNKHNHHNFNSKIVDISIRKSMRLTGLLLVILGAYSYFSARLDNLTISLNQGYKDIYYGAQQSMNSNQGLSNILMSSSMFFIPGIILLLLAYKHNVRMRYILLLPVLLSLIILLASGARAEALAIVIALFWLYSVEMKKIGKKNITILIFVGLIFVGILNTVATYRSADSRTIGSFIQLFIEHGIGLRAFASVLNEFGYNIYSLYHTINLIPHSQNYAYGYTYLAAILAILPSFFYAGHSFSQAAALPDWLMQKLALDYGPGYSIVAESYYNFGALGIFAMFAMGWILIKLLSNVNKNGDTKTIKNGFVAIIMYSNLFIARDTSLMIFRKYVYTVVIPVVLIKLFYSINKGKRLSSDG